MTVEERVPLAPLTSFGVGGPARFFIEAHTTGDVREAYAFAQAQSLPLRILGAGTNILVPDAGINAVVVRFAQAGHTLTRMAGGVVLLEAAAGASWDELVTVASVEGLWGIENLAGIPGSVGGALVQNIGAYGAEFSSTFAFAEVFDGARGEAIRMAPPEALLAYRTSVFKGNRDLFILRIALTLRAQGSPNLSYADLARAREAGTPLTTPTEVAWCVRSIRKGKFPERGCAGSFFKNPVIPAGELAKLTERYPELPTYPAEGGRKIALAWLLDKALHLAGHTKGAARLFERQPLVIVTDEGACAHDVEALAGEVEARVQKECGITLEREVETFA